MNRRLFLRRAGIATVGGLVTGNAALEMFERLTHRKVWALGGMPSVRDYYFQYPSYRPGDVLKLYGRDLRGNLVEELVTIRAVSSSSYETSSPRNGRILSIPNGTLIL